MKKSLLIAAAIIGLNSSINAQQQIPNGSFENWTQNGPYLDMNQWFNLNGITATYPSYGALRSTDAYDGTYALELISNKADATAFGGPIDTTAVAFLGQLVSMTPVNAVPFSSRPTKLSFYYKYTPGTIPTAGVDTAAVSLKLVQGTNTIAWGYKKIYGSAVNVYTHEEITLTYYSSNNPDTMNLSISSSQTGFGKTPQNAQHKMINKIGNRLLIDKLEFIYSSSVNEIKSAEKIKVYPNPAKEFINIDTKDNYTTYAIYNSLGALVEENILNSNQIKVNHLNQGLYIVKLKSNTLVKDVRFIKE